MEVYQTPLAAVRSWNGGEKYRVQGGLVVGFNVM
jgi:hypothetical protein